MQGPVGGFIYAVSAAAILGATDVLALVVSNEGHERTRIPPVLWVFPSVGMAKRRAPATRDHPLDEYFNDFPPSMQLNMSFVGEVIHVQTFHRKGEALQKYPD